MTVVPESSGCPALRAMMLNRNCKTAIMIFIIATAFCICCQDKDTAITNCGFFCDEQQTNESGDDFIEEFSNYIDYTGEDVLNRVTGTWNGEVTLHGETESENFALKVEPSIWEDGKELICPPDLGRFP